MPGLTDEGFVPRRQPEIQRRLEERLADDDDLAGLNLRAGPVQQLIGILSEELAEVWEAAEETWASQYELASGISLDRVAALTGTFRRTATRSTVIVECDLDAGAVLPAGAILARDGDPDTQFRSVEGIDNSGGGGATFEVEFEAVATGPVAAPAGTLTVVVTPVTGWTAASNPLDATLGRERAEDPELRSQRRIEVAGLGTSPLAAIRAAVAAVTGDTPDERPVREVRVYENVTMATVDGRPPKSIEVVLWDGPSEDADDDKIAQAIFTKAAGMEAYGVGESGTAVEPRTGQEFTIPFTRADAVRVWVDATVILVPGAVATWQDEAKEAIAAQAQARFRVGRTAYALRLAEALLELDAIEEVVEIFVGTAPSPVGSSVAIDEDEIATVQTVDITLGEA